MVDMNRNDITNNPIGQKTDDPPKQRRIVCDVMLGNYFFLPAGTSAADFLLSPSSSAQTLPAIQTEE